MNVAKNNNRCAQSAFHLKSTFPLASEGELYTAWYRRFIQMSLILMGSFGPTAYVLIDLLKVNDPPIPISLLDLEGPRGR